MLDIQTLRYVVMQTRDDVRKAGARGHLSGRQGPGDIVIQKCDMSVKHDGVKRHADR
jgi:hypothetical protein